MDRQVFIDRLRVASRIALEAGREWIEEPLPETFRYRVALPSAYWHPALDFGDTQFEEAFRHQNDAEAEIVGHLLRDGLAPRWVDIGVSALFENATMLTLRHAQRVTDDRLYYQSTEIAPRHPVGVALPWRFGFGPGAARSRFSN